MKKSLLFIAFTTFAICLFLIQGAAAQSVDNYSRDCQGKCGDLNNDGRVNISDICYLIHYLFLGGPEPLPVLACGDAHSEGNINVIDLYYILDFIFLAGSAPGNCSPGSPSWYNGDCCLYDGQGVPITDPNDPGIRDTVRIADVQVASSPTEPVEFSLPIVLFNDEELCAAYLGFYYGSGDAEIDSVSSFGTSNEHLSGNNSTAKPDSNLAIVGVNYNYGDPGGIPPGDSLFATLWFTLSAGASSQVIPVDSGFYPPAGDFILTNGDGTSIIPYVKSGSITVVGGPQDEITTDPVFLISPGGHTQFRAYMQDGYGDPIVGDSTLYVVLENCDLLTRCPDAYAGDTLYPEAPSNESGEVSFYLDGGNCDNDCVARIIRGRAEIATVPVKMLDTDGDLIVSYGSDFDYSLCNDYNGNGEIDFNDQSIWATHIGDSCAMNSCDRFEASFTTVPEFDLVAGQNITLNVTIANNNPDSCYIGLVSFFVTGFGTGGTPEIFGTVPYNSDLGPGEQDVISYAGTIPGSGAGTFIAEFLTDCCPDPISLEKNLMAQSACVVDLNKCYEFVIVLDSFPVDHIDTLMYMPNPDWLFYYTHNPGFPLNSPDSLVYEICTPDLVDHGDTASLQTYICYDDNCTAFEFFESYVLTSSSTGDANRDCKINVSDAVYIINYVFIGGAAPNPCQQGDTNCDGSVNVSDAVILINYVFLSGFAPPCQIGEGPEPQCGKMEGVGTWH